MSTAERTAVQQSTTGFAPYSFGSSNPASSSALNWNAASGRWLDTRLRHMRAWRTMFTGDATFWQIAGPTFFTGAFVVMVFVPVTGLAMASVDPDEAADGTGGGR